MSVVSTATTGSVNAAHVPRLRRRLNVQHDSPHDVASSIHLVQPVADHLGGE